MKVIGSRGRVYNRIYTEEEWNEVNKLNKALIDDFLEEYKQRKIKDSTIKQYFNDLRIIMLYIYKELDNKYILELNKKDFRRLSIWLSSTLNMSNARSNRVMSATRSLLTYIENDDDYDYDNNVARKVKGLPKEPVKTDEDNFFLSFEQVMKLRAELIKRGKLQHAVLLMMFFDSGGRRNEVLQIKKKGILEGNKTNIVVGKRGKLFPLVYLDDTKELIREYLNERGEDDIDSLWITGKGENKREATYETLYERVMYMSKVLSEIENKNIQFFPHSLRHTKSEVMSQGLDTRIIDEKTGKPRVFTLQQIQIFLHHTSSNVTEGYLKDHSEDMINEMFNFS